MRIYVQRLSKSHYRKDFDCGLDDLNRYFREVVGQDVKNGLTHCFVMCEESSGKVIGFYTLCASEVHLAEIPQELRRSRYFSVPCMLIGRLAVDKQYQRTRESYGSMLLADAIKRVVDSEFCPFAIVVDMKTEELFRFYSKFGFQKLNSDGLRAVLVLPRRSIPSA